MSFETAAPAKSGIRADNARKNRCTTLLCVLENPKTIANLGTAIRTTDSFGISKMYLIDGFKIYDKKKLDSLSVSASRYCYVRVFKTTSDCLSHLEKKGYSNVMTSPHVKECEINDDLNAHDFTQYKKLAVWFGNESTGISKEAIEYANACISIKMCGIVESLNLASCHAIAMYVISEQRRAARKSRETKDITKTYTLLPPING